MPWPLVGREGELETIRTLIAARSGGAVLSGAAGVGRTRLASEAAALAKSLGFAVEWVSATRSAAAIPLGAFAGLLPATRQGAEILAAVRHALADRAGERPLVLCVDDAHALDDASAALVHQLVTSREAVAIVTVVSDEAAPDAVRALWKDELCTLVELGALSRGEVARLLEAVLGGPLDGRSLDAVWRLTLGNALFVRELVRQGLGSGYLAEADGVWVWRGEVTAGTRLRELAGLRLEGLAPGERRALELVALGAPLGAGALDPAALETLEERALVELRADGRRRAVDVTHPLYAELVRAQLAPTRLAAVHGELADALDAHGARRRGDALRHAVWRLEAGGPGHAALFERGAGLALAVRDASLAERLARAAERAGGGFAARLALGRALAAAGRAEEADAVLATLEADADGDAARAAVAIASARNLLWGLDRPEAADAALRRAETAVAGEALRHELMAQRVRLAAANGRPREALAVATPLLRDARMPESARLHAAIAATGALFSCGRADAAVALAGAWLPIARRHGDELPHAEPVLDSMRAVALRLSGRLGDATIAAERTYALAVARHSAQTTAVEAMSLGLIWLARGRVRTALRFARECTALLRGADATGMRAVGLAAAAQAAAQAGDAEAAAHAVQELERASPGEKGFERELDLARAWAAAAAGEHTRARGLAREAAGRARSRGQDAYAVRALHELCRLGEPAAAPLAELAARVEGPFAHAAAAHAAALERGDAAALIEVAERFAALDALLVAAEAAGAAAAAFRAAGRDSSARAAAARATALLAPCEGARSPAMVAGPEAEALTPREREIALLAASGLASREIAERLVVSVRTVDNHLQRAFHKLGVQRRQDLARVLSRD